MADDNTTDVDQQADDTDTTSTDDQSQSDDKLGEGGKKALDAERKARRDAEKAARAAADRQAEMEAELAKLREGAMSDQEKALEQARKEAAEAARSEVLTEVRGKRLATEIRAAATGKFADPEDAAAFLATEDLDPDDPEAISVAIDELLEKKPHLKAGATQANPGDIDQGARDSDGVRQLTRDDLKLLSPDERAAAFEKGQLRDLLAGKS